MIRAGRLVALALGLGLGAPAAAQDAAQLARRAAEQLLSAAETLGAAQGASDRVAALTDTVAAYEAGLGALRDGVRQVTLRQQAMADALAAREGDVKRLLGVLATLEQGGPTGRLVHPSGPLGTARASMMLADVLPALEAEAAGLRDTHLMLADLRALEEAAAASLAMGIAEVQATRLALSEAVAARTDLPPRLADDSAQIAALVDRVDTLRAFADGLGALPPDPDAASLDRPMALPVAGTVLRQFQEPDAAGIPRPGWVVATDPGATVTAPAAGTVRYGGPLLDYGNVIILEPQPDLLVVFGGLAGLYVKAGDVVVAGAPLAEMGGATSKATDFLRETLTGGSTSDAESLYLEVREAGRPVDPKPWFAVE